MSWAPRSALQVLPANKSSAISPFNFEGKDVRVIADKDGGEPWFVARDVAAALGYAVPDKAVRDHCKGATDLVAPSAGGPQRVRAIREPDVYRLVMKSKLPSAGKFEKLVFEEILPSIRKKGRYEFAQPAANIPNFDDPIESAEAWPMASKCSLRRI